MMITFEDVKSFRRLIAELEALRMEQQVIYDVVHSPGGKESIGGAKGNGVSDPTADAVRKMLDLEDKIEAKQAEIADRIEAVHIFLNALPNQEVAQMCRLHYIAGLPWRMVAVRTYYADGSSCRKKVLSYFGEIDR